LRFTAAQYNINKNSAAAAEKSAAAAFGFEKEK